MIYKLQVMELTTAYSLKEVSNALFQWFDNIPQNFPGECHFLINNNENMTINVHEFEIENKQWKIAQHLDWLQAELWWSLFHPCEKSRWETKSFTENFSLVVSPKMHILMKAFLNCGLHYWLLIWIYYSHTNIRKISRLRERYLRIIYNVKHSLFMDLLAKTILFPFIWGTFCIWLLKFFMSAET